MVCSDPDVMRNADPDRGHVKKNCNEIYLFNFEPLLIRGSVFESVWILIRKNVKIFFDMSKSLELDPFHDDCFDLDPGESYQGPQHYLLVITGLEETQISDTQARWNHTSRENFTISRKRFRWNSPRRKISWSKYLKKKIIIFF